VSYARVSRGPWRLKAFIDVVGRPVTSRFITARPHACSLEYLWALLNSPIANAYVYTHLAKRDNLVGDMRKIPVPKGKRFEEIDTAARAYLDAAHAGRELRELQKLMIQVDASVLRAYGLPAELEKSLLTLFTDWDRVGVPFQQNHYFPPELTHPMRYADFVAYESDWPSTNRRRGELIDKEIGGTLSSNEVIELAALQAYADYYLERVSPRPLHVLEKLEDRIFGEVTNKKKAD
jgi:hypothetical protein